MTMGEAMREARTKAGFTQKTLCELSGVRVSQVSSYERDLVNPSITIVEMLADTLGISIDEYVGHEVKAGAKNATH